MAERLPDFLGIGAQKAGTTWLHRNLRAHRGIFLPKGKELHYFNRELDKPLSYYQAHFAEAGNRIAGEITPAYSLLSDDVIALIKHHMPDLRIILMVRHPVDRAWSHALMDLTERRRLPYESLTEEQFLWHFQGPGSVARGDYDRILERWTRHFAIDKILLLNYSDISTRPREVLERVFGHLQLPIPSDWRRFPYDQMVHQGVGVALPDAYATVLRELYREPLMRLEARLHSLGLPPSGFEV